MGGERVERLGETEREHVVAADVQPQLGHLLDTVRLGARGVMHAVERPDGRAHHKVGPHARRGQRAQHPYLRGAQAAHEDPRRA